MKCWFVVYGLFNVFVILEVCCSWNSYNIRPWKPGTVLCLVEETRLYSVNHVVRVLNKNTLLEHQRKGLLRLSRVLKQHQRTCSLCIQFSIWLTVHPQCVWVHVPMHTWYTTCIYTHGHKVRGMCCQLKLLRLWKSRKRWWRRLLLGTLKP